MREFIDVTGKTEDEAVSKALAQLGLDRDDVSVEILERAKKGLFGIGYYLAVPALAASGGGTRSKRGSKTRGEAGIQTGGKAAAPQGEGQGKEDGAEGREAHSSQGGIPACSCGPGFRRRSG